MTPSIGRLSSVRTSIVVREGRVVVSGREYLSNHVYMDRVSSAYIEVSPIKLNARVDYRSTPIVKIDGGLIKIGTPLTLGFNEPAIVSREKRDDIEKLVIENIDLKIRVEENGINVIVEGVGEYKTNSLELSINDKESATVINILTKPFTSIWIHSRGRRKLLIRKGKEEQYFLHIE